ncbi:hypothetical protein PoB_002962900 [Plakobranchus ocellatus]|uniref:Uncharacterized protein n=1 Tax=Plakobranchus ocellatus TaxID=259542 RepID=A0AAV4A5Z9_9GAST|nr:hypothetical protein PoB_002962900 [Plakobranchus ocellatus]
MLYNGLLLMRIGRGGGSGVGCGTVDNNLPEICRDSFVASSSPATGALAWRRARKSEITLLWTGYKQKNQTTAGTNSPDGKFLSQSEEATSIAVGRCLQAVSLALTMGKRGSKT